MFNKGHWYLFNNKYTVIIIQMFHLQIKKPPAIKRKCPTPREGQRSDQREMARNSLNQEDISEEPTNDPEPSSTICKSLDKVGDRRIHTK